VGNSLGGYVALQTGRTWAGRVSGGPARPGAGPRATSRSPRRCASSPASHQIRGAAACATLSLVEFASREGYHLDAERITCPVRIIWGTEDKLLPWPSAATRFRDDWLPRAEWVELDGVGHCPQLDVPLETAQLIVGLTAS
jgi:pimeloyl-ACP methyl ester carboxylesterase